MKNGVFRSKCTQKVWNYVCAACQPFLNGMQRKKNGKIIGGCGVIENDFHDRPDLSPNVCAVYTEKDYRGNGIAGALLEKAASDMK